MAHSLSAKKRIRQNKTSNARNRARKTEVRTVTKSVLAAIDEGNLDEARQQLQQADRLLAKTAAKGTIHPNTAARRRSRLAKKVNAAAGGGTK